MRSRPNHLQLIGKEVSVGVDFSDIDLKISFVASAFMPIDFVSANLNLLASYHFVIVLKDYRHGDSANFARVDFSHR
jgi:hypothetical protein